MSNVGAICWDFGGWQVDEINRQPAIAEYTDPRSAYVLVNYQHPVDLLPSPTPSIWDIYLTLRFPSSSL